jgi:hypothetical protein
MKDLAVFLNTRVEDSGALAWIGDKGLAPVRYLCNGKTILVEFRGSDDSDNKIEIHHVTSFHKQGAQNRAKTYHDLQSSSTGMIKTVLSVVFLIPGLMVGAVFKGLAYLSSDVREKHSLAKEHLTPINREIGTRSQPMRNEQELKEALSAAYESDLKHRPTDALIIHGNGTFAIHDHPEVLKNILKFNSRKLILENTSLKNHPELLVGALRIRSTLISSSISSQWNRRSGEAIEEMLHDSSRWNLGSAKSIEEAVHNTPSDQHYHLVFQFHQSEL